MIVSFPSSLELEGEATRVVAEEVLPSTLEDPSPILILVEVPSTLKPEPTRMGKDQVTCHRGCPQRQRPGRESKENQPEVTLEVGEEDIEEDGRARRRRYKLSPLPIIQIQSPTLQMTYQTPLMMQIFQNHFLKLK